MMDRNLKRIFIKLLKNLIIEEDERVKVLLGIQTAYRRKSKE